MKTLYGASQSSCFAILHFRQPERQQEGGQAESRPWSDPHRFNSYHACMRPPLHKHTWFSADMFSYTTLKLSDAWRGNKLTQSRPTSYSSPSPLSFYLLPKSTPTPFLPSLSLVRPPSLPSSILPSTPLPPPLHLMGPLTDSWLWLWLWKMGQSRQQSPPPAFLQHDCALSPYSGAGPVSASLPLPPSVFLQLSLFLSLLLFFRIHTVY